ncbi:MAG: M48 family metalloprotease [Cytophagales bacterium]|jgi:tetratricopeptide (TPR) repeat protein|nr:M48 family metalloprotease [Cytophagales bacterium]
MHRLKSILCFLVSVAAGIFGAAAQTLPTTHYKYNVAQAVMSDVAAAFGNNRPRPELAVLSKKSPKRVIARYVNGRIEMDELLYDLCRTFGADSAAALACVLGHELAHHYRNHIGSESFSAMLSQNPAENSKTHEAEADYYGVFYGFVAGYDTYSVIAPLYKRIYQAYRLPDNAAGYPSEDERIRIARQKADETKPLAQVLETGKVLFLKGDYPSAARCFRHVLDQFPAREIYNNLGVCYLSQAAYLFTDRDMPFAFPFELDPTNRLLGGQGRGLTDTDAARRTDLLEKAEVCFRQALALDNAYAPVYVNLSVVQVMQGVPSAAVGTIDLLARQTGDGLPPNAYLMRGIALVKNQQMSVADRDFTQAARLGAFRADYNLQLYRRLNRSVWDEVAEWIHSYLAPAQKAAKPLPSLQPKWDNNALKNTVSLTRLAAPDPVYLHQNTTENAAWTRVETATQEVSVMRTLPSAKQPWIGSRISDWLGKFRAPDALFVADRVSYYVYRQSRLLLEVKNQRITAWTAWQTTPLAAK